MSESKMDLPTLKNYLPHRYPFLLVDRVVDLNRNERIVAYKNVTANEEIFNGHFPTAPIYPGVMIIEALAQASGILVSHALNLGQAESTAFVLAGIDKVRFKRQVLPGDRLQLESCITARSLGVYRFNCRATVEGELACTTSIFICAQRKEVIKDIC